MRSPRPLSLLVCGLLLLAVAAAPLAAYTIYLKDGSQMLAREKYRVENGRAIITLPNGTETFLNASEIDAARTEQANLSNLGTAVVVEEGRVSALADATPPPPRQQLSDLIEARKAAQLRELPEQRRAPRPARGPVSVTPAGYQDLLAVPRTPYRDTGLSGTLMGFFQNAGADGVMLFQGTNPKRLLVEVTTASEASVFRTLLAASSGLLAVREQHGAATLEALELVMTTPQRARAGQFVLTPDQASGLLGRKLDVSDFYVANVQF
ncbi:MAG TPA: hypothetical protein VLA75_08960 [Thermoanaerobaculia bacterium]|nr:hypothetical protein [Thermoanaerobaculia bacterium]